VADESLPRPTTIFVTDERRWRTPVDVVIVRRDPERRFLAQLLGRDADSVTAWVKSPDTGFYSLPFAITQNGDTHYGNFNPDWILRVGDDTLIVETKENDAVNDENRAKVKGAHEYVRRINELRADLPGVYRFFMLTPNDYTAFFKYLKTGSPATFEPLLETTLAVTAKPA
jgi:type III restriction enzyme